MRFSIEKSELQDISSMVQRAASSRNNIPVLSGMLLEISTEFGLRLSATDMEIGIKASTDKLEIEESGTVLVKASYFADLIRSLPDTRLNIALDREKMKLDVHYGRSAGHINLYQYQEYPDFPPAEMQPVLRLPQNIFKEAIRKTYFAASASHFRQVFTGFLIDIAADNTINVVATDMHRMAEFRLNPDPAIEVMEQGRFIVPVRTGQELLRLLGDSSETVEISAAGNNIVFSTSLMMCSSRIIEGEYPAYQNVIPARFISEFDVDSKQLQAVLDRAKLMPVDDRYKIQHVKIENADGELKVNSFSESMGEIQEVLEGIEVSGEQEFSIIFNTNYLMDITRIISAESEKMKIKLSGSQAPALICNMEKDNYIYVLVPLRQQKV